MAIGDISERRFAEDRPSDSTSGCPECGGQVRTNSVETTCEECGPVLDESPIDHALGRRAFDDDENDPENGSADHADPSLHSSVTGESSRISAGSYCRTEYFASTVLRECVYPEDFTPSSDF
jgi:hypothetical protein